MFSYHKRSHLLTYPSFSTSQGHEGNGPSSGSSGSSSSLSATPATPKVPLLAELSNPVFQIVRHDHLSPNGLAVQISQQARDQARAVGQGSSSAAQGEAKGKAQWHLGSRLGQFLDPSGGNYVQLHAPLSLYAKRLDTQGQCHAEAECHLFAGMDADRNGQSISPVPLAKVAWRPCSAFQVDASTESWLENSRQDGNVVFDLGRHIDRRYEAFNKQTLRFTGQFPWHDVLDRFGLQGLKTDVTLQRLPVVGDVIQLGMSGKTGPLTAAISGAAGVNQTIWGLHSSAIPRLGMGLQYHKVYDKDTVTAFGTVETDLLSPRDRPWTWSTGLRYTKNIGRCLDQYANTRDTVTGQAKPNYAYLSFAAMAEKGSSNGMNSVNGMNGLNGAHGAALGVASPNISIGVEKHCTSGDSMRAAYHVNDRSLQLDGLVRVEEQADVPELRYGWRAKIQAVPDANGNNVRVGLMMGVGTCDD